MHIFCDAKNAHFRGIYEWESPRGLVNGNSLDFGKAGGLMKSPIYGYLVKSPAFPKFSSSGYTQKCLKYQLFSMKKSVGTPSKIFKTHFFIDFFLSTPTKNQCSFFTRVTFSILRIVIVIFASHGHF